MAKSDDINSYTIFIVLDNSLSPDNKQVIIQDNVYDSQNTQGPFYKHWLTLVSSWISN